MTTTPPFRADHVGSLLRPPELAQARADAAAGQITPARLREIEDRCIRDAIHMQEQVGLHGITDGEFRRAMWHTDFLTALDGIEATQGDYAIGFRGAHGETGQTHSMLAVRDKVRHGPPIMVRDFAFLRSATRRTPKVCIPSPTWLHLRGGRAAIDDAAYPDIEAFWADVIAAYQAEIAALAEAGLTYLQLDDVSFACLCDASIQEQVRAGGEDPMQLVTRYAEVVDEIVAARPPGLAVTLHTCRGNFQSMWMAEGGYDPVAETVFNQIGVDGFFVEYDTDRAGNFEPLRYLPPNKKLVLGLVSTKMPELESKDVLKRRVAEAAAFAPVDQLCVSPQCGFASTHHGNRITPEMQRQKLELVVELAHDLWGTAV